MKEDKEIINSGSVEQQSLIKDLRQIIEQARGHVAATANYELTMMYWHIGERINREVLGNQRAEYGKQIVAQVATQLQEDYGKKGFEIRNIRRMMQFAALFPQEQIVSQAATQLTWSHFLIVMPLKDELGSAISDRVAPTRGADSPDTEIPRSRQSSFRQLSQ
jgi:hypothetical protein